MTTGRKKTTKRRTPPPRRTTTPRRGRWGGGVLTVLLVLAALALGGGHGYLYRVSAPYRATVGHLKGAWRELVERLGRGGGQPAVVIADPAAAEKSPYDNLRLGIPAMTDTVIDRVGYAVGYSRRERQARWVSYRLTAAEAQSKAASRSGDFRTDLRVPGGSATPEDYRGSGFDRGHLAPAADMAFSEQTMSESFLISNMSPQKPDFNRGVWKELESTVRSLAIKNRDLYIVTGPIFDPSAPTLTVGANRVAVPQAYYKVVYDASEPTHKAIGFILPNRGSKRPPVDFAVTVDAVEAATGLDFFNRLPKDLEARVEGEFNPKAWDGL